MSARTDQKVVVVTGASSGFGAMTARELAQNGHIVFAGMRAIDGRNATAAADATAWSADNDADLRPLEMDVSSQPSVDAAIERILRDSGGRLDVVVHNAGHMVLGPTESFTVEQIAASFDTNVLSTQRVNRAALPHLRGQGSGLLVWVGSTSTTGGTPPYLAPYFAAKAAGDALAVSYAAELARFGIDSVIVVPGSFTTGTNHFANAGHPEDSVRATEYDRLYAGLMESVGEQLAALAPPDADPHEVAVAIADVVDTPVGQRPHRVHIDPADDGATEVDAVKDRVRRQFYQRIGLEDLLRPATAQPLVMPSTGDTPTG